MAPQLYGAHTQLACEDCGFRACFRLDLNLENLLCPNCGAPNSTSQLSPQPSLQVAVEHLGDQPQRWEIVAFQTSAASRDAPRLTVKRTVGLPGEELRIAEGDLWVNGQRISKTWDQQQALAILLRDFDFLPHSNDSGRISPWHSAASPSAWKQLPDGVELNPAGPASSPTRLEYRHWAGYHSGRPRFEPVPVLDAQPFDPREARPLLPVYDLLLSGEVATPQASFQIVFQQYEQPLSCEFSPATGKLKIRQPATADELEFTYYPPTSAYRFGVSTFDRQLTIAINDRQQLQVPINLTPQPDRQQLSCPLYLETSDGPVRLRHIKLFRDVYYLERSLSESAPAPERSYLLGQSEFLVLGDNPLDSIDSRDWAHPGLPRKQIIGRVRRTEPPRH